MYAVIKSGAHQYRVAKGDVITVDSLQGEQGDKIKFDEVLMCADGKSTFKVGAPLLSGASVTGTIKSQGFHDKVMVLKYLRRKNHKKSYGHRQPYTLIEINDIVV